MKVPYILITLNQFLICFPLHFPLYFPLHFILDYTTRISRSVLGRYLGRIDPRFHISRDLSVESGLKVSKAGPGSVRVLRPNSGSDFQYRPVLDVRSVGSVPRSNPASTRPESITVGTFCSRRHSESVNELAQYLK